ncbi:MAG: hypothetical protein LLG01_19165 [Planctomycetaceae bacterium]|nr:hypothetical protein [Planctomycetaceae bacterium]
MDKPDDQESRFLRFAESFRSSSSRLRDIDDDRLKEIMRALCPVCDAVFVFVPDRDGSAVCTYCQNTIYSECFDPNGHQDSEILPDVPTAAILGVLTKFWYPQGTQLCMVCGEIYPVGYSACPSLVLQALKILTGDKNLKHQEAARQFLKRHLPVLENCLLHRFKRGLHRKTDKMYEHAARELGIQLKDQL